MLAHEFQEGGGTVCTSAAHWPLQGSHQPRDRPQGHRGPGAHRLNFHRPHSSRLLQRKDRLVDAQMIDSLLIVFR